MPNALLTTLSDFKPREIYTMAPRPTLAAATRFFEERPIRRFAWGEEGSVLTVNFDSAAVEIRRPKQGAAIPHCRCDCRRDVNGIPCSHVLVALMGVCRLLRGTTFGLAAGGAEWDLLGRQLGAVPNGSEPKPDATRPVTAKEESSPVTLVIYPVRAGIDYRLEKGKRRLDRGWSPFSAAYQSPAARRELLTPALQPLFAGFMHGPDELLSGWLDTLPDRAPHLRIAMEFDTGTVDIPAVRPVLLKAELTFRRAGPEITAVRSLVDDSTGAVVEGAFSALTPHLALLADQKRLGVIDDPEPWDPAARLRCSRDVVEIDRKGTLRFKLAQPSVYSPSAFNDSCISFPPESLQNGKLPAGLNLVSETAGGPVEARPAVYERTVALRRQPHGTAFRIEPAMRCDGQAVDWTTGVMRSIGFMTRQFGMLMKSKQRRDDVLAGTWNLLMAGPDALDRIEREVRRGVPQRRWKPEIEDWFEFLFAEALPEEAVLFAGVADGERAFLLLDRPGWSAAELMGVIFSCLKPTLRGRGDGFDNPELSVPADADDFPERLGALIREAAARDITVTIDGQPVASGALDLSVTMTRTEPPADQGGRDRAGGGEIDWFELKPEVRCGELTIPPEKWDAIIRGGLITNPETGEVRVIDGASLDTLREVGVRVGALGQKRSSRDADPAVVPRLEIFDWLALAKRGVKLTLPPEDQKVVDVLVSGKKLSPVELPKSVDADLRDYQKFGYQWLAFRYAHRFGGILADDMGLGKTLQTIALLAGLKEKVVPNRPKRRYPHLAVLPPTLVFNWRSEIERFCPKLRIAEYIGSSRKASAFRKADVVLTTYDIVRRDIGKLAKMFFDVLVFDEAQFVKNFTAARSVAMRRLRARFRLCLTGTPVENHVGEYYSIVELAVPGIFGDRREFLKDARDNPGSPRVQRAAPFLLRRTKQKILKELPPKVESNTFLDLTKRQKEIYHRTVGEVRAEVMAAFAEKPKQQAGIIALAALTRLRQVCISPAILDPEFREVSPKFSHLVTQLAEIVDEGHAALVFSQFTRAFDSLEDALREGGISFQRMDGSTPPKRRRTLIADFQNAGGPPVFLVSLKTGGAGLNLTRASYVFHLDPWWNPAVEAQASDRAHRIGQTSTVFIHRLLMRHTVEEKMMALKARKQALYDQIMAGAEAAVGKKGAGAQLSADDMKFLLE